MLSAGQTLRLALLLARYSIRLVQATAVHGVAVALNQFAAATGRTGHVRATAAVGSSASTVDSSLCKR